MLKRILGILAVALALTYVVFATVAYSHKDSDVRCQGVVVVVKDSTAHRFVRASEIRSVLKAKRIHIVGRKLDDIDYTAVESAAESHKLIRRAECFSTPSGVVFVHVWQHVPIIRIMSDSNDYYLNREGRKTGLSDCSAADVLVASGNVCSPSTVRRLYKTALLLQDDPFWDAQIEQIYVEPDGEWTLIPRVGDCEILLGLPNNVEDKLQRLQLFYKYALPAVGWNRYGKLNLKFDNQVVCTKKE